jgi:hypothetical protein
MPRKHPQVLWVDLNPSESSRPAATVCPASQRDRVLLERAADPLHRAEVHFKLFDNDAATGLSRVARASRIRFSVTAQLVQRRPLVASPL